MPTTHRPKKLSIRDIDAAPTGVETMLWCGALPGFGARCQASGRKTFIARFRTRAGQQRSMTIGRCCDLMVDQARNLARAAFAEVAAGGDPAAARQEARAAPTMADLEARYWKEHAPYKKPSSLRHDKRNWPRIQAALGRRRVAEVTKSDCTALHASWAHQRVTANHIRALLSKAMSLAVEWGWRTDNPVERTPRFKIAPRETILTPAQLAMLDAELDTHPLPFANLIRLLAITGCRLNEIMSAERSWVDLQRRVLVLPDSKTGPRQVPLPAAAISIIQAMSPHRWLIPGRKRNSHLSRPNIRWDKLVRDLGLPAGLRIHDLRHTAGSLGHQAGLSQRQIADQLGHRDLATTARYLHGAGDRAAAAERVAEAVTAGWRRDATIAPELTETTT